MQNPYDQPLHLALYCINFQSIKKKKAVPQKQMDDRLSNTSTSMGNNSKHLHIAMLPWAAFGHLIPFLNLAKSLSQKGHSISFISTSNNIKRLPKSPPNITHQIQFIELSLPPTPGLPHGAEATSDLSYQQFPSLKAAYDRLQPQLLHFLESSSPLPHWLLLDFAPYWAVPIASKLGIRTAFFSIAKASTLAFMGPFATLGAAADDHDTRTSIEDWTVKPRWVPFDSNMAFRYFEAHKMSNCLGENVSGATDGQRLAAIMRTCDVIAPRSSFEFEAEWIKLLAEICGRPVVPVGHLPPDIHQDSIADWQPVKEWLAKWPQNSVIYVAFGSEATLTREELTEVALGLEMSNLPFFWALKTQKEELPEGFVGRTQERGVICSSWAPQLRILSHASVGGFLCHSGWSSVIEGIILQKPLILFPLYSDQGLVARVLEEKRLGYTIPRDERDGSFTRRVVAESLRMLVVGEDGRDYRLNVKEISPLFADVHTQARYVDSFADFLQTHLLQLQLPQ